MREEHLNAVEMRAGHGENVGGALDQRRGQGLAADAVDIDPFVLQDLDREQTRRLPAHRMDPGGCDGDVFSITQKRAEKTLRHRTPADVSGADEKDVFHGRRREFALDQRT